VNPEAHQLVLEGRHFWNLRTTEGVTRAEAAFAKAIESDPEFAPAHAGLADVLVTRAIFECYAGANQALAPLARAEAQRAIALDPTLADGYPALGMVLLIEGRLTEAEEQFGKAFALNPNYALAHHWYALVLENQGRLDPALGEIDQAIRLDPLSTSAHSTRGRLLLAGRRFPEALGAYDQVLALRANFPFILGGRARCLLALGRRDEALAVVRLVEAAPTLDQRWVIDADAIYVLRQMDRQPEAADHVDKLLPRLPEESYLRGSVLAALGRWPEAEPYLLRTPKVLQSLFFWNPVWDQWRDDPRFHQLLVKLGCADAYAVARAAQVRMADGQETKK
jgi:tetratricopeptide (TPR) repeat protein